MNCPILLEFGMLVTHGYPEAVQQLKPNYLEIQAGGRPHIFNVQSFR